MEQLHWELLNWAIVSFVSGLVMGVCTIKGYELLGKKLSKLGIGISIFFMLVMILFVHQLDWALLVSREVGTDVFTAFSYFTNYLLSGGEVHYTYWLNLGLLSISLQELVPTYGTQCFR